MSISGDLLIDPLLASQALHDDHVWAALDRGLNAAAIAGRRVWLPTSAIALLSQDPATSARLNTLRARCQWLAALADEANAFDDARPRLRQLEIALSGLDAQAVIVTADRDLRTRCTRSVDLDACTQITPAPIAFIDLAAQQDRLRGPLERRIATVVRGGHYIMGPEITELESALARYVGVKHAISVASGTDSLEIALRALGIGPGDEVITVPFTWISTAEVIGLVGATPVFVDIDAATFNLDPAQLVAAITPRTKCIMPVSLFGQMPNLEAIAAIAGPRGIPVMEDGAQSFGATRHGARSCGATLVGSTSFFPAKPLGCYGDGGALFTDDEALAAKMRAIRTHGGERRHHHPYLGMNGRLDTLQAAVLLAKLPAWDWEVAQRNRLGARYTHLLRGHVGVPEVAPGNTHVYAQYTIRSPQRDALADRLKHAGIPTAVYYPKCLHEQPIFAGAGTLGKFPIAEAAAREVLSLPMHPDLTATVQDRIISAITGVA